MIVLEIKKGLQSINYIPISRNQKKQSKINSKQVEDRKEQGKEKTSIKLKVGNQQRKSLKKEKTSPLKNQ